MKRITLSLLTCSMATAVFAQSAQQETPTNSITVYGVADAAYSHGSGSLSSKTALVSGGNMTSRIGVKGDRALSNGITAGFVYEAQVFTDSGEGQPTNATNQTTGINTAAAGSQGLTFARRSTVSLSNDKGEIRLGRDFTAHYRNRVEFDPFGNAGIGAIQPFAGSIGGSTSTRASNMIAYFLPKNLNGFYGQVQHYVGENASNSTEPNSGNGNSARLGYNNGSLNISAATGKTSYLKSATTGEITSTNLGISYTLPVATLMGAVYRDTVSRTVELKAKGWVAAAVVPYGNGDFKAAYSRYGTNATGNPETNKLSVGYVYNVMKDTVVYATYARVNNTGGATAAIASSTTAANRSSNGYEFGMRYSF